MKIAVGGGCGRRDADVGYRLDHEVGGKEAERR